jgi:hypothetical protein
VPIKSIYSWDQARIPREELGTRSPGGVEMPEGKKNKINKKQHPIQAIGKREGE